MKTQGMPHTVLSGEEVRKRFPQFNLTDADHAVYQADGGLVDARKGNAVHISLARVCHLSRTTLGLRLSSTTHHLSSYSKARGVRISANTVVELIQPLGTEGAKIITNKGAFSCKKLIMASGAWTKDIVKSSFGLDLPLWVTQEQVAITCRSLPASTVILMGRCCHLSGDLLSHQEPARLRP
jgi:sarcosine oxidase